ncbi:S-adenosyl-L-methionine-dependent methyltransferase [Acrodontium crateriforme]|uniref:S-adenosyl-L-methionine-dependent methyltransferase n=1 Tax=Acrodontium crateriforme TaxID=150365 RepID=A0AAQ3M532_9PEZI|nr:S-adenosyl-L-methionine-dependent methyltransferase [Acrodontium crateriforme]
MDSNSSYAEIEVIEAASDSDSGYAESVFSTATAQSSIFDYEIENGRSYHAFKRGKYVMPNDEGEQDRMDIHYHSLRLTLEEKHFISPIDNPTHVLDIGTGTGIWAMDVADDYPNAQVVGIDLSPIQPTAVPPNLEFQIMDADEDWDFDSKFDLIHTRLMNGFSIKSWPFFYQQAFQSMQPGGWVENQEFGVDFRCDDGTQPLNSAVLRWQNLWNTGIERLGLTGHCYPELMKQQMEDAGFINTSIKCYKMPVGPWPKDPRLKQAGFFNLIGMVDGVSGLSRATFTRGLGWTIDELEVLLVEVKEEWKNKRIHSYLPIYVISGQKPCSS